MQSSRHVRFVYIVRMNCIPFSFHSTPIVGCGLFQYSTVFSIALSLGMNFVALIHCAKFCVLVELAFCGEVFDLTFVLQYFRFIPEIEEIKFFLQVCGMFTASRGLSLSFPFSLR